MDTQWVDYYNRLARSYADPAPQSGYLLDNQPVDERVFDNWVQFIQRYFAVSADHYLLDVGCGSGLFLKRFAGYTNHLYGVDPSEEQLANARSNCPTAGLRVGTATDAGFGDVRFDRIICNSVFLYFPNISYAGEAVTHFLSISSGQAKIWIGDLPLPTPEMREGGGYRRTGITTKLETQHYPPSLMERLCRDLGVKYTYVKQEVEGKVTAAYRYDWLIEKKS